VIVADGRNGEALTQLRDHSSVDTVELKEKDEMLSVTLKEGLDDCTFIAELLVRNGFKLKMVREEEIDLEDVFMGITKGITN
jgi:ABC-2 type transport system ATP-binding protein